MPSPATTPVEQSEEEDIVRTRHWDHEDPSIVEERRRSKGKKKDLSDGIIDNNSNESIHSPVQPSYPPVNDDQAASRRVEETLKQWEAAELQRRKAARQSITLTTSPSLVDNVSRRATLLLSGRNRKSGSISRASHEPLPTQDSNDAVPLTSIPASPTPSPSRSETDLDDPFNPPSESQSPFADPIPSSSVNEDPSFSQTSALAPLTPGRTASFTTRQPPPALPLGLPAPKSPPPLGPSPNKSTVNVSDPRPTRWWHEWLCGCGEGPDRGGEHQAGKTNPYE